MSDESEKTTPSQESPVSKRESDGGLSEVEQLKADLTKAKSDYLYLLADFDNQKKNFIKERSELIRFGSERLIRELLAVVDNFERALENDANIDKFREGIKMIHTEMATLLHRFGVAEVPAQGLPFDPSAHEALSSEPTDAIPPNHVSRVFKKAYKLHDKLIRPAQVVVSTAKAAETTEPKDEKNNGA